MSKDYRDEYEESLFLMAYVYRNVRSFATIEDSVTPKELIQNGGSSGKLLGEFFAAEAVPEIDLTYVRVSWQKFHEYLRTGAFERDDYLELMNNLADTHNQWQNITRDFKQAGEADENGFGAPLLLFAHGYAHHMLKCIYSLEMYLSSVNAPEIQRQTEQAHLKRLVLKLNPEAANDIGPSP